MNNRNDFYPTLYFTTLFVSQINLLRVYSLWGFYDQIGFYLRLCSLGLSFFLFVFSITRYKGRESIFLCLSLFFVLLVSMNADSFNFMWVTFALVVGAKGIPFRSIVKVHFLVSLCFCLLNVVGYELGMLKQANNYLDDIREGLFDDWVQRLDFGYGWCTDFANHVFFILLDFWILQRGKLNILGCFVFLYISYFLVAYSDSRLAALCILLLVFSSLYLKWICNKEKEMGIYMKWSIIISMPFFAIASIFATIAYEESNLYWLAFDLVSSGRLSLGSEALYNFGIPMFGQPVEMHGAIDAGGQDEYNYVDCTYVHYLIRFGIFFLIFLMSLVVDMSIKAARRSDSVLLLVIIIVGFSGIIAQFVFDLKYCVLILALMATHHQSNLNRFSTYSQSINKQKNENRNSFLSVEQ